MRAKFEEQGRPPWEKLGAGTLPSSPQHVCLSSQSAGPSASQVAPHPCPYVHTTLAVKRPGGSVSSVPGTLGSESGTLGRNPGTALPPGCDRAGNWLSLNVSWVHRAAARALGPSEVRNSEFSDFRRTVCGAVYGVYMVTPPQGSGQHPKIKHRVFPQRNVRYF